MSVQPGDPFDKYQIESVLGEGGMATVYLARHNVLQSQHALKVLRIDVPEVKKRLLDEGRVQAAINHPNVVSVTDIVDAPEGVALVMEYVQGHSLEHYIDEGPIPVDTALSWFRGITLGIAAAHRSGLVHRDLKPANILLHESNAGLIAKVTDFGLVKILATSGTKSGILMGTPEYMSPEQVRDSARVDTRSDLWSLGALLHEMLGGEVTFQHEDIIQVYTAIVHADYRPLPPERNVPAHVEAAVVKLLQIDPADRFQTAEELLAHLYPEQETFRQPASSLTPIPTDEAATQPTAFRREEVVPPSQVPTSPPRLRSTRGPAQPVRRSNWMPMLSVAAILGSSAACTGMMLSFWGLGRNPTPAMRSVGLAAPVLDHPAPLLVLYNGNEHDGRVPIPLGEWAPGQEIAFDWVLGEECGDCPGACAPWCLAGQHRAVIAVGDGAETLTWTPPGLPLRQVIITVPEGIDAAFIDDVPLTVSDGKATGSVLPGKHALEVYRACGDTPRTCANGDCPPPCAALTQGVAVPIGEEAMPLSITLPAPTTTTMPPAQVPAVATTPRLVSAKAFARFIGGNPEWSREAAIAAGRADDSYLRAWTDGPPAGPVTRVSWSAAQAFCGGRGGLLDIDAEPLAWPESGGVTQEWRASKGNVAWRRFDGVTSTVADPNRAFPFTGLRCRR